MKFDENLAAIHGYLCSDGYVSSHNKPGVVNFTNTEKNLVINFKSLFEKIYRYKNKIRCEKIEGYKDRYVYACYFKEIRDDLLKYGSYYCKEWQMPIKYLSKRTKAIWLRAFFDSEAWVEVEKGKNRRISVDCLNEFGMFQIQNSLIKDFGINSVLKKKKGRTTLRLEIFGKVNLIKFQNNINFLHKNKKKLLSKAIDSFIIYKWIFPEEPEKLKKFIIKLMKKRGHLKPRRYREVPRIRIDSILKENLIQLSNLLLKYYDIESKVFGPITNGYGTRYYELSIHQRDSFEKTIKNNLINKQQVTKLTNGL